MNKAFEQAQSVLFRSARFVKPESMKGLGYNMPYVLRPAGEDYPEQFWVMNMYSYPVGKNNNSPIKAKEYLVHKDEVDTSGLIKSENSGDLYFWYFTPWRSNSDMNHYRGLLGSVFRGKKPKIEMSANRRYVA